MLKNTLEQEGSTTVDGGLESRGLALVKRDCLVEPVCTWTRILFKSCDGMAAQDMGLEDVDTHTVHPTGAAIRYFARVKMGSIKVAIERYLDCIWNMYVPVIG